MANGPGVINLVQPLAVGAAMRLYVTPGTGTQWWRVLRRTSDAFTGPNDKGAVQVVDESTDNVVYDSICLVNGTLYFYQAYFWDGAKFWGAISAVSGTPAPSYTDLSPDPQEIVIDRLQAGLAQEVAAGRLTPGTGKIPVLSAPFARADQTSFPCVSVHHDTTSAGEQAIGTVIDPDELEGVTGIGETWGFLSNVRLAIVGLSMNADERKALRQAIRRILVSNLTIFDSLGMSLVEFSQTDNEDFDGQNAPIYRTDAAFSCMAPVQVAELETAAPVTSVSISIFDQAGNILDV